MKKQLITHYIAVSIGVIGVGLFCDMPLSSVIAPLMICIAAMALVAISVFAAMICDRMKQGLNIVVNLKGNTRIHFKIDEDKDENDE